jgi:large subunit ribosomal protein L6
MSAQAQPSAATAPRQSRVGKRPIPLPKGVSVSLSGRHIEVQGPRGKLSRELPDRVEVKREADVLTVHCAASGRDAARLQGLARALVANMVRGVDQGYSVTLELVGTGYRAEVNGQTLALQLGLSHQAIVQMPASVTAVVPPDSKGTRIIFNSPDKEAMGQTVATVRSKRPPEPYGGKGVRLRGEQLRRKAGKAGKKAGA